MGTIIIISVLVGMAREPIAWLDARNRGLGSFVVLQTFKSHHDGNQPLLHVPNKHVGTITNIFVLVGMVREPIV
jgi:hypothetical protein